MTTPTPAPSSRAARDNPAAPKPRARRAPGSPPSRAVASAALLLLLVLGGSLPALPAPAKTGWDGAPQPTGNPSLPWISQLGRNRTGSVATDPGAPNSFDVVAGGRDAWDNIDEVTFVHTQVTGDFDVRVRVESLESTHPNSKAGIMIRGSLAEDSRMFFLRVTPPDVPTIFGGNGANTTRLQYRTGVLSASGNGGDTHNGGLHQTIAPGNPFPSPPYPNAWLRLSRSGNSITAHNSNDGSTWHLVDSVNTSTWGSGSLPPTLHLGLAASPGVPWDNIPSAQANAAFRDWNLQRGGPANFSAIGADSRGNPKGIEISFNKNTGPICLEPAAYSVLSITPFQGFSVSSVLPTPDPAVVRLNLGSTLTEGRTYTVTVSANVADSSGQPQVGNKTFQFVHGAGYEARRIHSLHNLTDGTSNVEVFTGTVGYNLGLGTGILGSPPAGGLPTFASGIANNSFNENFGERIAGLFLPPQTGTYTFYLTSDDSSALFVSPNGNRANLERIARMPGWNPPGSWNTGTFGPDHPNVGSVALTAGVPYWLEAVGVDGIFGNHLAVHVQPPGALPPVNGDPPTGSASFTPTRMFAGQVFHTLGNVAVTKGPEDQSAADGAPVTFRVTVDGTPPWSFQWLRDGAPLPGETAPTLTFPITLDQDGNTYSVIVSNLFSTTTSLEALLTVLDAPRIVEASWKYVDGSGPFPLGATSSSVLLTFSRRVSDDSLDPAKFSIDGVVAIEVWRGVGENQVILLFPPHLFGPYPRDATVPLQISGVTDEAGKPLWLGLGNTFEMQPDPHGALYQDGRFDTPLRDLQLFGGTYSEEARGLGYSGSLNLGGWGSLVAPDVAGAGGFTISLDAKLSAVQGGAGEWSATLGPDVPCTLIPPVGAAGDGNWTVSIRGYNPNQPFAEIASENGSHATTGIDLSTGQDPDGFHRIRIETDADGRVWFRVGDLTVFDGVQIPGFPPPSDQPLDIALSGTAWNGLDPVRIDNLQICAEPGEPPVPVCPPGFEIGCDGTFEFGTAIFLPGSSPLATIEVVDTEGAEGPCGPSSFTRTWTATDTCGRTIVCSQTITVVPPALTIDGLSDLEISEDGSETVVGTLLVQSTGLPFPTHSGSATSSNQNLVRDEDLVVGFSTNIFDRGVFVLPIRPLPNAHGTAIITVTVRDFWGREAVASFQLTVLPGNDPPTLTPIDNQTTDWNTPLVVPFQVGDAETPAGDLTITIASSDVSVIPPAALVIQAVPQPAPAGSYTLTITPKPETPGAATITFTVADAETSVDELFQVEVTPPAPPPPTRATYGALSTNDSKAPGNEPVTQWELAEMLDRYFDDGSPGDGTNDSCMILVFTQCYGGNFLNQFNETLGEGAGGEFGDQLKFTMATVITGNVPGLPTWYDNADKAMVEAAHPEATAEEVHQAGLAHAHPAVLDPETGTIYGENPQIRGDATKKFHGENGTHVLVWAGQPEAAIGEDGNPYTRDLGHLKSILDNFNGTPGTTVTVLFGKNDGIYPIGDHTVRVQPATRDNLDQSLQNIGGLMLSDPGKRFVLFVLDHGLQQQEVLRVPPVPPQESTTFTLTVPDQGFADYSARTPPTEKPAVTITTPMEILPPQHGKIALTLNGQVVGWVEDGTKQALRIPNGGTVFRYRHPVAENLLVWPTGTGETPQQIGISNHAPDPFPIHSVGFDFGAIAKRLPPGGVAGPLAEVVGRHVAYNQSFWDGDSPALNAADDAAIAPDKTALRPGQKATFANYASFHRGLNGVVVDLAGLVGTPASADFALRVGNSQNLATWSAAPAPLEVLSRPGAGVAGSTRVTLRWADGAIRKQWLEVTVRATPATGLEQPDVFYFGNAIGETGNSPTDARVSSVDALRVLTHLTAQAGIADAFDVNRDGRVGAADRLRILGNLAVIEPLVLLDLTGSPAAAVVSPTPASEGHRADWRRTEAGLMARVHTGRQPLRIRTRTAAPDDPWEILETIEATGTPGGFIEALLPVDPEESNRQFRFDSLGNR
jgi:hypothetical protein